jgi:hypothetical protein
MAKKQRRALSLGIRARDLGIPFDGKTGSLNAIIVAWGAPFCCHDKRGGADHSAYLSAMARSRR